eukprot:2747505-Rhodomonas_salina.2
MLARAAAALCCAVSCASVLAATGSPLCSTLAAPLLRCISVAPHLSAQEASHAWLRGHASGSALASADSDSDFRFGIRDHTRSRPA